MPGETPLETVRQPRPVDDLDRTVTPPPDETVSAGDIDPLMGDEAPVAPAAPVAATSAAPRKRRWWQRIIEFDEATEPSAANGNGHVPVDVGAEANVARWEVTPDTAGGAVAVDPLADWAGAGADTATAPPPARADEASATTVTPEAPAVPAPEPDAAPVAEAPAVDDVEAVEVEPAGEVTETPNDVAVAPAPVPAVEPAPKRRRWRPNRFIDRSPPVEPEPIDEPAPLGDEEWNDSGAAPAADDLVESPSDWATVPLTDLPEGAEPDALETAPVLGPARTGEFPRVPMPAVERARLEPEPLPQPTWLQRRRAHRPRVRRVTRVVRRIDTWTVFKLSLLFWSVAYLILLVAGVLLWSVAISTGTVDNVESFIKDLLALDSFTFDGQKIFRASWVLGAFMAVAGTGFTVTMAVLYNLFADLVGGVRVTVLEEEVVQRPPSRRVS